MERIDCLKNDNLWDVLGLKDEISPILSVVGAGGKTSLIRSLSKTLSAKKKRHIIMTTTHMFREEFGEFSSQIGSDADHGKIGIPDVETLHRCMTSGQPILIEADGSHGYPCKAPEVWEPVILKESTHVFAVLGASAIGCRVDACCHRPEKVMALLECGPDHMVTVMDFVRLASSPMGLMKNVQRNQKFGVIINQVDCYEQYCELRKIKPMLQEQGIDRVWFTKMGGTCEDEDSY